MTPKSCEAAWQAVRRSAVPRRQHQIASLRAFLSGIDNAHARALSGTGAAEGTIDSARKLEHVIVALHVHEKLSSLALADWFGLIHAACRNMDPGGKRLPQTRLAAVLPPRTSPFVQRSMEAADLGALWRERLAVWIRAATPKVAAQEWAAAVVLSSVVYGALLDPVKLRGLIDRINKGTQPDPALACRTFAFDLPFQGLGNYHLSRWVLDPITEMLLYRLPQPAGNLTEKKIVESLAIMLASGEPSVTPPTSLRHLVDCASADWTTRAAPVDLRMSQRGVKSHAFHEGTWARFNGFAIAPKRAKSGDARDADEDALNLTQETLDDLRTAYPWLQPLQDALSAPTRQEACNAVRELHEEEAPRQPATTYLSWVEAMLYMPSASGTGSSLESLRERVDAALPQLLGALGDTNPVDLSAQELEDIYADLSCDLNYGSALRHRVAGLRDFHAHLVKKYGKDPIKSDREVFGDDGRLRPVDASLPSFDDYALAKAWLDDQCLRHKDPTLASVARLVLMLAFRLGMRRMEIFGLQLKDIALHDRLMVIVRPNSRRGLKTIASKRTLPAYAFLSSDEVQLLRDQIALRQQEKFNHAHRMNGEAFLFAHTGKSKFSSWVDRVSDLVCEALRSASGDARLFLHHCRHAFGTWTTLSLRAAEHPGLIEHFRNLPLTAKSLNRGRRLAIQLGAGGNGPGVSAMHCVARLLGHSHPAVSLGHYMHAADLMLGEVARREVAMVDLSVLLAASGLSTSAGYEALAKGLDALVMGCRRKFRPGGNSARDSISGNDLKRARGRPRKEPSHQAADWTPLLKVLDVLNFGFDRGFATDRIITLLHLQADAVNRLLAAGRKWGANLRLVDSDENICAPANFRGEWEQCVMDETEAKLAEMANRAPKLYHDGLKIHLVNLDRNKWDTVFRGAAELPALKCYLRFLASLGLAQDQFRWVVRHPDRDSAPETLLPQWAVNAYPRWAPAQTKRIAPPNAVRYQGFARWAGVQMVDESGDAAGKLLSKIFYLAIVQAEAKGEVFASAEAQAS